MKPVWRSKTMWANVLGGALAVVNGPTGTYVPPEILAVVIAGLNLVLRVITIEPVSFG